MSKSEEFVPAGDAVAIHDYVDETGAPISQRLLVDVLSRIVRAIDAFADGEPDFAVSILEHLRDDLEAIGGRR